MKLNVAGCLMCAVMGLITAARGQAWLVLPIGVLAGMNADIILSRVLRRPTFVEVPNGTYTTDEFREIVERQAPRPTPWLVITAPEPPGGVVIDFELDVEQ